VRVYCPDVLAPLLGAGLCLRGQLLWNRTARGGRSAVGIAVEPGSGEGGAHSGPGACTRRASSHPTFSESCGGPAPLKTCLPVPKVCWAEDPKHGATPAPARRAFHWSGSGSGPWVHHSCCAVILVGRVGWGGGAGPRLCRECKPCSLLLGDPRRSPGGRSRGLPPSLARHCCWAEGVWA